MVLGYNKRPAAVDPFKHQPKARKMDTLGKILLILLVTLFVLYVVF